jgi:SSS family solute:Na+ symporter
MNSNAVVADIILGIFMLLTIVLGLRSVKGRDLDLKQWSVGGRSLGAVFVWVLMAGEIYTSYSYLGAAGWGYQYGVPIFYEFAYLSCGYAIGYFIAPLLWNYANTYNLVSTSEIAEHRFQSPFLGMLVAILATIFLLPYIQLELTGMGVVVSTISYGTVSLVVGYIVAFVVSEGFVVVSGLHGSAWVSVLKDILVIGTMLVIGIYIPFHFFGGYAGMFTRLIAMHRAWLVLPGHDSPDLGVLWFVSTGIINSVTFNVFPSVMAGFFSAKNPHVLRANATFLPFYQLLLFVPMLMGMAAVLLVPHLTNSNLALFAMADKVFPSWFVGLMGVAGALSAIVPMAVFSLVIGTMWTRNVFRVANERRQKMLAQIVTLAAGLVALLMAIFTASTLVRLSVISYEGLAQLVPILLVSLIWKGMTKAGAISGLVVGTVADAILVFSGHDPLYGINAGLITVVLNLLVNVAVSLATQNAMERQRAEKILVAEQLSL